MAKIRADLLVVAQGLAESRTKAQALILAGVVLDAQGRHIEKAGEQLAEDTVLRIQGEGIRYVSRGGMKMEGALKEFEVTIKDKICLDVGASTGGFTDCLLQHGARRVYALDVGYGQMAWSLSQDERVVVLDRTNIREAESDLIPEKCEIIVFDVSFISLRKVIEPALRFAAPDVDIIALVKPQFEVGKGNVGKGGIVRDEEARERTLLDVSDFLKNLDFKVPGTMTSPIFGAKGNKEFLLWAQRRE